MSDDDALEALLRAIAKDQDPVPPLVTTTAGDLFGLRTLDAEVADLVADSWAQDQTVAVRDAVASLRMLTFTHGETTIEVDVEVDDRTGHRSLRGFVTGAAGDLVVERPDERITVLVESGQFVVEGLGRGPVRLVVGLADGTTIATTWVSL